MVTRGVKERDGDESSLLRSRRVWRRKVLAHTKESARRSDEHVNNVREPLALSPDDAFRKSGRACAFLSVSQVETWEREDAPEVKKMVAMSSGAIETSGTSVRPAYLRSSESNDLVPAGSLVGRKTRMAFVPEALMASTEPARIFARSESRITTLHSVSAMYQLRASRGSQALTATATQPRTSMACDFDRYKPSKGLKRERTHPEAEDPLGEVARGDSDPVSLDAAVLVLK